MDVMPRKKLEFHVTGSGKGPPTADDLMALLKSVSGETMTPEETAEFKADYDAMIKRVEPDSRA